MRNKMLVTIKLPISPNHRNTGVRVFRAGVPKPRTVALLYNPPGSTGVTEFQGKYTPSPGFLRLREKPL